MTIGITNSELDEIDTLIQRSVGGATPTLVYSEIEIGSPVAAKAVCDVITRGAIQEAHRHGLQEPDCLDCSIAGERGDAITINIQDVPRALALLEELAPAIAEARGGGKPEIPGSPVGDKSGAGRVTPPPKRRR